MPWKAFKQDEKWCVYKVNDTGEPDGEALGCHETEEKANAQVAALYANEPGADKDAAKAITRAESDGDHPAGHYLVVEDPEKPTTWHLRVRAMDGKPDHGLMGAAWAALHEGYRGNRYEGPDKEGALRKLRALYEAEGMETPSTRAVMLKSTDAALTIGGYGVVFGGQDLTGETFTPETDFWFDRLAMKPLVLYQHGKDDALKKHVLGYAQATPNDLGIWVQTQIALSDEYAEALRELVDSGRLGWSSGAVGHLTEREGKTITVWPIVEFSLTPTPAEPRTLGVRELESLVDSAPAIKALLEGGGKPPAETAQAVRIQVSEKKKEPEMAEENVGATQQIDVAAVAMEAAQKAVSELWEKMKSAPAIEHVIESAPEGKDHPETKDFGDFCIAVMRGDTKRLSQVYKSTKSELAETSGEVGGYLVPPEYSQQLLQVATEGAIVRPRATVIPMATREYNMPALDFTATASGQPHSLGGVVANWTEEGGEKTETEPEFKTVKLVYHELSGYTVASNMIRQDAGAMLSTLLTQLFGRAISWYEDYAFLRGSGSGQPLGIYNWPGLLCEVAATSSFVASDAAAMLEMFTSATTNGGVWVMHPKVLSKLIAMADGSTASNNVIWIPNARENLPATLFGKPILFSEKMPVLPPGSSAATKGGVLLADFSYYLIGDRKQITIDFSEHYKFINNQGTWRFCEYVDGQPWMSTYWTLADGSTTVSPFVSLKGA